MSRKDIVSFKKRVTYDGVRKTRCDINMEEAKSETSNEQENYQPHSDTESAYSTHTKQDTSLNDPPTGPVGLQLLEVHIK
jgi:flagellar biosynthesis/type III secretory pathway M-ring protein FliF/YscJ